MGSIEDLSTPARIRTSAIELFGQHGFAHTTVRQIAEHAGVSPGLVIHHFGSKSGLRAACDAWIRDVITTEKDQAVRGGFTSVADYVREHPDMRPLADYIARTLRDGGALAGDLFSYMCEATEALMTGPNAALTTPADPGGTAAVLVAYSCGALMLGPLVAERLGGEHFLDPHTYERYGALALEILSPTLTPRFRDTVTGATHDPQH